MQIVYLTYMYHMNFAYGRFSPVRGCGFLVVARVAPLRERGWLSAGLCDYEQAYWSQTCRRSRSVGAELGRVLSVPAGGCRVGRCRVFRGPVRFAALADMWMRPMTCLFFLYFIMSHYIYTQRVYYICMSYYISTQRFYYIYSFMTSLYILALYILALFVVVY